MGSLMFTSGAHFPVETRKDLMVDKELLDGLGFLPSVIRSSLLEDFVATTTHSFC